MDFEWSPLAGDIRQGIKRLCARFGDEYWERKDRNAEFPWEFYNAVVEEGWLGVTVPTSYGGGGLGILEASIIEQEIAASGAGMNGCSAVHIGSSASTRSSSTAATVSRHGSCPPSSTAASTCRSR